MEPNDMADIAGAFRKDVSGPGLPSAEQVAVLSRRGTVKEAWSLAKEVVSSAFAAVVLLTIVVKLPSVHLAVIASVILAALVVSLGYRLHVREGMWTAAGSSVLDYARLDLARKQADLRLARAQRILLVVLVAAFCAWLPFYLPTRSTRFSAEPWRLPVVLIAAFSVFGAAAWRVQHVIRQARGELARSQALFGSLSDTLSSDATPPKRG